jgi:hypothetical protein
MSGVTFGPDGTSECVNCGKKFNSIISTDFAGRLCNKCYNGKKSPKQDTRQDSEQDSDETE